MPYQRPRLSQREAVGSVSIGGRSGVCAAARIGANGVSASAIRTRGAVLSTYDPFHATVLADFSLAKPVSATKNQNQKFHSARWT
jgi:hypothetical protein